MKLQENVVFPREWGAQFIKQLTDTTRSISNRVNNLLGWDVAIGNDLTVAGEASAATAQFGGTANYAEFEADGTLEFHGDATVWDDMLGAAISLQQSGPGVSRNLAENQVEFTTASNLSDYLIDTQQISHAWDGTTVYPHIHFFQTTSAMPNFLVRYRWQKMNTAKTTDWTDLKCNSAVFTYPGSGTFHQLANTAAGITPPSGAGISDCIQFRVIRDNANTSTLFTGADPVAATVAVTSFDTHIAKNTFGSRSITTK